jgi:outer membrane protein assembly factor BamB
MDGNLYALKPDGTEQWRYHTGAGLESTPVLDENEDVYLPVNNLTVSVSKTGQRRKDWYSAIPFDVPPAIVTARVYVSRPWRMLNAITEESDLVWIANLQENLTAPPMVDDRGIIYVCAERYLYAIQPPGELLPPAKSSWPMFRANVRHTGRVDK